jgi:hypothetical protein
VTKVFVTDKPVIAFTLDPFLQTADTDLSNNAYPRKLAPTRFELFEQQQRTQPNPMQQQPSATQPVPASSGATGGGTN